MGHEQDDTNDGHGYGHTPVNGREGDQHSNSLKGDQDHVLRLRKSTTLLLFVHNLYGALEPVVVVRVLEPVESEAHGLFVEEVLQPLHATQPQLPTYIPQDRIDLEHTVDGTQREEQGKPRKQGCQELDDSR